MRISPIYISAFCEPALFSHLRFASNENILAASPSSRHLRKSKFSKKSPPDTIILHYLTSLPLLLPFPFFGSIAVKVRLSTTFVVDKSGSGSSGGPSRPGGAGGGMFPGGVPKLGKAGGAAAPAPAPAPAPKQPAVVPPSPKKTAPPVPVAAIPKTNSVPKIAPRAPPREEEQQAAPISPRPPTQAYGGGSSSSYGGGSSGGSEFESRFSWKDTSAFPAPPPFRNAPKRYPSGASRGSSLPPPTIQRGASSASVSRAPTPVAPAPAPVVKQPPPVVAAPKQPPPRPAETAPAPPTPAPPTPTAAPTAGAKQPPPRPTGPKAPPPRPDKPPEIPSKPVGNGPPPLPPKKNGNGNGKGPGAPAPGKKAPPVPGAGPKKGMGAPKKAPPLPQ